MAGKPGDYTYEDVAGNLRISEVRLLSERDRPSFCQQRYGNSKQRTLSWEWLFCRLKEKIYLI
ncbi:hypothetical protein H6G81_28785 [Scytonema hofmannii FACHB-248]|uniref:Uncharacterized protein n=1 Tax=Scytonema hofmannii FACHB-248 TaxID=1842502 RepID=A0ABR8GYX3_9CYAN|nr:MULTISPECIES: hypothetical protein [Nostocales]MBD2608407.1 hypothetical protein [Scytonema hofmannii FACHB-248]